MAIRDTIHLKRKNIPHPNRKILQALVAETLRGEVALNAINHVTVCAPCADYVRFLKIRQDGPQNDQERDLLERGRKCYD